MLQERVGGWGQGLGSTAFGSSWLPMPSLPLCPLAALLQVRQLFERFAAPSAAAAADARFEFFKASVWPRLAEAGGGGLLLVVPSYFDFVRLR